MQSIYILTILSQSRENLTSHTRETGQPLIMPKYHPLAFSTNPHRKIVGIEHSVDRMTIFVAKSGAQLYFDESMLVVAGAGIAASRTARLGASPVTTPSLDSPRRISPSTPGTTISRSTV